MSTEQARQQAAQLVHQNKSQEAINLLRNQLLQTPAELALALDLAHLAISLNQLDLAIRSTQSCLRYHPNQPHCLFLLGNAYRSGGLYADAAICYKNIIEQNKHFPYLHYYHGIALQYSQQYEAALQAYRKAHQESPSAISGFRVGSMLHLTGKIDDAIVQYQQALALDPNQQQCLSNLALAFILNNRAEEAIPITQRHMQVSPQDTMAYANQLYACLLGGDIQRAKSLLDIDTLMYDQNLLNDQNDSSLVQHEDNELYDQVTQYLLDSPKLDNMDTEDDHHIQHGYITEEINPTHENAMYQLQQILKQHINRYLLQLQEIDHPWVKNLPTAWDLKTWGNIQHSGGYENAHCHPEAFISGILYIKIPEQIKLDDDSQAGWIQFGQGDDSYLDAKPDWSKSIHPKVGRLLLFPSYFFHKTFPFESNDTRISLSINIVPTDA